MSSDKTPGHISVTVQAGHIQATETAPNHIGQQITMAGASAMFYIKPDVARQWISVLETIAREDDA